MNLNQPPRHGEASVRHNIVKKVEDFSAFRFVSCGCLVQYEIPESEGSQNIIFQELLERV